MKIIVDAMGGDNAPVSNVRGALAAVRELGVEVILVGRGRTSSRCSRRTASANCPGAGDCPRLRGGGDVRQPGHRL